MNIVEIVLIISIIINIFLAIGIRNLMLQVDDAVEVYNSFRDDIYTRVSNAVKTMRDIDIRGSFESDDEVGTVFNELKDIVEDLEEQI